MKYQTSLLYQQYRYRYFVHGAGSEEQTPHSMNQQVVLFVSTRLKSEKLKIFLYYLFWS